MKKYLLISLLILIIGSGVVRGQAALLVLIFGEKAATENFHFSLKAGINYSMIHGYNEGTNRIGANFGLINNIRLNDRFTLAPEFLPLSQRGIKDVPILTTGDPELDELLGDPSSTDRKLSYIEIPVLLKVKLSDRFSISAGPQVSFLTGATDTYKSNPVNDVVLTTEIDIQENINTVDVGFVADITFVLSEPKNGKGANIYLRYSKGFIDLVKDNPGDAYTQSMIQFGMSFPFVEKTEL